MRWVLGLAVVGFAWLATLPGAVDLRLADLPDPQDEDLTRVEAAPSPEPNAFDSLTRAAEALAGSEAVDDAARDLLAAEPFDREAAAAQIGVHAEALSHFEAALAAPGFRMPDVGWDDDLPNVQAWFTVARLHALDVRLQFEQSEQRGSGPTLRPLLELGQRVQADPSATWIHWIAGAQLKEIALRTLIASTSSWEPTAEESRAWAIRLDTFAARTADLRAAWAGEYRNTRSALLASLEAADHSYFYQPNRTLALQAAHTRALQARAGRPCVKLQPESDAPRSRSPVMLFLRGLRPNAVGEILAEVARPNSNRFALRRCAADTLLAATQLTVALAAARRDSGRLPDDLSDLVPTYLDSVPTAAYDGTALRLDASGPRLVANGSSLPEATVEQQSPEYPLPF